MSQVALTAFASNLGANHPVTDVLNVADMIGIERFEKTRPSGAGFELGGGSKQGQAAQTTTVHPILLIVEQAPAKGRFGPVVEHDPPLLGSKALG